MKYDFIAPQKKELAKKIKSDFNSNYRKLVIVNKYLFRAETKANIAFPQAEELVSAS
jgi:DNA primase